MLYRESPDDIAIRNLRAARGLPGAENLDVDACVRTLNGWADRVAAETNRVTHLYRRNPCAFGESFARFQAEVMVTVLQRDLGVHYRQELIDMADERFFARADHLFLHGVIAGVGGTCSSLPPVFLPVGRRLGYPLRLVHTYQHGFVRWDDTATGERFNIECTARGFVSHADAYYLHWPHDLTAEQARRLGVLRSLTAEEEEAAFLAARGCCLRQNGRLGEAAVAYAKATHLDPEDESHVLELYRMLNAWDRQQNVRLMRGFPAIRVYPPPRQFSRIPADAENGLAHLWARELVLGDAEAERRWWGPLRRQPGVRPAHLPAFITVVLPQHPNGKFTVTYLPRVPVDFEPKKTGPC